MRTIAFILLGLLVAWWLLLSAFLTLNYWKRARGAKAKTPLTAADKEEYRQLDAGLTRVKM
jgi:hypothetical protein